VVRASTASRSSLRFGAAALAALVAALLVGGCSGDKKKQEAGATPVAQAQAPGERAPLRVGTVAIESAGPAVKLPKAAQKRLLRSAQTYVDTAVHEPLTAGDVGKKYDSLFARSLRDDASGRDRNALTERSLGKASAYTETVKPVKISGLADGSGALLLLATNISMKVTAEVAAGKVTIRRDAEFTYGKSGDDWLVTAYRVKTVRKVPKTGKTTTTVARRGTP
jgi:hypothetical protein